LEAVAFLNPNGQLVAIVLNRSDEAIPFALQTPGAAGDAVSLAHSIGTYLFRMN